MPLPLNQLQDRIGYHFQNPQYLERAVTHSSYAFESGKKNHHLQCNERLEFLGDAVLSVLASQYIYRKFPTYTEGELTKMRSGLVCEEALSTFASEIDLGSYLLFGKGEKNNGGERNPAILADAFEAILAAIYLDAETDGMNRVSAFLIPFFQKATAELQSCDADSKTLLQMFLEKDGSPRPQYRVVAEKGPDHAKIFFVEVYLDSNCIGVGRGTTKRQAEQEAAANALHLFGVEH